LRKRNENCS